MCQESKQTSTDRSYFRFPEEVKANCNYLVANHGFRCLVAEASLVRYESDCIFINVYHGRSSCEIGLEIGRVVSVGELEEAYNISWLIKLIDPAKAADYRLFVATTPDLVKKGVSQLCELFKKYVGKALFADESAFELLEKKKEAWKEFYEKEVLADQVRPKANEAFHNKNYSEAVFLYESIRSELTPAELKKMEYARKYSSKF